MMTLLALVPHAGQSNMGFTTAGEYNATAELAAATSENYPHIKLFAIQSANTSVEAADVKRRFKIGWTNLTTPGNTNPDANPVAQFSAVCWNAGKTLSQMLSRAGKVHPLGMVDTSLGSTRVECWMPPAYVAGCAARYNASQPGKGHDGGKCSHVAWVGPPGTFYNGMIAPLARTIRPAALVYYQGENNMWDGIDGYHCLGDALAVAWRSAFSTAPAGVVANITDGADGAGTTAAGAGATVPWFVVQLAPCCGDNDGLIAGSYIREAQRRTTLTTADAHLIVLNDLGDAGPNLLKPSKAAPATHPKNKTEPGRRLALELASRLVPDVAGPPTALQWPPALRSTSLSADGNTLAFTFSNATGLHWMPTHNCSAYSNSSIAGEGSPCCSKATQVVQLNNQTKPDVGYAFTSMWTFVPAALNGDTLVVQVPSAAGGNAVDLAAGGGDNDGWRWVRFQFDSQPLCVLANEGKLPTSAFVVPIPPPSRVATTGVAAMHEGLAVSAV